MRTYGQYCPIAKAAETLGDRWARHEVRPKAHGVKRFDHPVVGPLELHYESLAPPGDEQTLVIYRAGPGSASERPRRLLAGWTLTTH